MNNDMIELSILIPAFLAGIIVMLTHVPLGQQVLNRGIIFIDLAVAQIAGLGVIAAEVFFHAESGWIVQLSALIAALLGSYGLYLLGKRLPKEQEALIGIAFVLAASTSILLLSNNPHGGEHLREILSGQILWVTYQDLIPATLLTIAVFLIWWLVGKVKQELSFYLSFAVAVTISVQLIGVYLVFATLIIPALAVRQVTSKQTLYAMLIATFAYLCGLILSAMTDWPTSPSIIWCLTIISIIFSLAYSPKESDHTNLAD